VSCNLSELPPSAPHTENGVRAFIHRDPSARAAAKASPLSLSIQFHSFFCPRRAPIQYSPFYFLFSARKELHLQLRSHTSSDSPPPPLKSKHFSLNASLLDRLLVKYYLRPRASQSINNPPVAIA
jgi:hypothetical protein